MKQSAVAETVSCRAETAARRGLDIAVVVWGADYVRRLCELTLASLNGAGNVPDLPPDVLALSRLMIVTRPQDRALFTGFPAFRRIAARLQVEFIDFDVEGGRDGKMAAMSRGHRMLLARILRRRSACVFLTADMVFAAGSIVRLQRWLGDGVSLVLAPALRFEESAMLRGLTGDTERLSVSARDLAAHALTAPHPETLTFDWKSSAFAHTPAAVVARAPDRQFMTIHSLSWAPLLMDYAALHRHHGLTLKTWTMDGDYVSRNFADLPESRRRIAYDSDQLLVLSLSSKDDPAISLAEQTIFRLFPFLAAAVRRRRIRRFAYSAAIDPLKRTLFRTPALLHARDPCSEDRALLEAVGREIDRALVRYQSGSRALGDALLGALELTCNRAYWTYWIYRFWGVIYRSPAARIGWCLRNRGLIYRRCKERLFH